MPAVKPSHFLRAALRLATLTLALVALVGVGQAQAAEKAIWGPTLLPDGRSAFPLYRDLGVSVYQMQLSWASIATRRPDNPRDPDDPAYAWPSKGQAALDEGAASNPKIAVAMMIRQTPTWANDGTGVNVAPTRTADYADFVAAARRKYPAVDRWMIWGETNRTPVWSSGPTKYADLVDAAYGELHSSDPTDPGSNKVVAGMTFTYGDTSPAGWMASMRTSAGARPRFDEWGHNPFARRCPDVAQGPNYLASGARDISDVDTMIPELAATFGAGKKLWLSEFTVSSNRASRAFDFFVDRATQAAWLTRAYRIAAHYPANVSGLGWFNLQDEDAPNGLTNGLLDVAAAPKPAYAAYKAASKADTGLPGPCSPPPPKPKPPVSRPAPSPHPQVDSVAPGLTVAAKRLGLRALTRRGLRATVSCTEACTIEATLTLDRQSARRLHIRPRVARKTGVMDAAGTRAVALKPSGRLKRKLLRLRRARLGLQVTVRDRSGNASGYSKPMTMRR